MSYFPPFPVRTLQNYASQPTSAEVWDKHSLLVCGVSTGHTMLQNSQTNHLHIFRFLLSVIEQGKNDYLFISR